MHPLPQRQQNIGLWVHFAIVGRVQTIGGGVGQSNMEVSAALPTTTMPHYHIANDSCARTVLICCVPFSCVLPVLSVLPILPVLPVFPVLPVLPVLSSFLPFFSCCLVVLLSLTGRPQRRRTTAASTAGKTIAETAANPEETEDNEESEMKVVRATITSGRDKGKQICGLIVGRKGTNIHGWYGQMYVVGAWC